MTTSDVEIGRNQVLYDQAKERPISAEPVILSWSGGKDSALALARLAEDPRFEVVGLLTTVTAEYDRISIHGVRRSLLHSQARQLGLALHEVKLQSPSSDQAYQLAWSRALQVLRENHPDVRQLAFGDIFLEDVRQYRENLISSAGFGTVFPLWGEPTPALAAEVLDRRIVARLVCVDTHAISSDYAGRIFDEHLLEQLPAAIDPCGERGEFHTFVSSAPGFQSPVTYRVGETILRDDRFAYCDLLPTVA